MKRLTINEKSCKSCRYCIEACPNKALFITKNINHKGYPVVGVDQKKCISCGICFNVCPDYVFEIMEVL